MKKLNRIIAGITAVSLCSLALIPVTYTPVFAEETTTGSVNQLSDADKDSDPNQEFESGNFKYRIVDGQAEILGVLDDSSESIDIPDKIDGKTVACIGHFAFKDCKKIKKITLPDTLQLIGLEAFANTEITEIDIPDSVKAILPEAFLNCKNLECIDLSGNSDMKNIYNNVFEDCISLSKVILPETLECISSGAFRECTSLTEITFPESIAVIDQCAFSGCTAIKELNLPKGIAHISDEAFKGCTSISKIIIPENTDYISADAFSGCSSVKEVTINSSHVDFDFTDFSDDTTVYLYSNSPAYKPETAENVKFVLLDDQNEDFRYTKSDDHISINGYTGKSDSVIVPETIEGLPVTQINENAFENSSFSEIIIPDCVKSIGEYAFSNCESLSNIKLPDGLPELENYVFKGCKSLEKLIIPSSVKYIDDYTFEKCSGLKEINLPEKFEMMGEYNSNIFGTCNCLSSVTVDENNKNFSSDDGVLYSKDKTRLMCYPRGKAKETFVVPENVTGINNSAFIQCENLKNVKISGDCCTLSEGAFWKCNALVSVDIGKSEGDIPGYSFVDCPLLKNINVSDDNKSYSSQNGILFSKDMKELILYLPGCEDDEYIIPDNIEIIREHAFFEAQNLKTLVFPEGMNYFDNLICVNCNCLEKLIIKGSAPTLDVLPFTECSNLTSVEFGKNTKQIFLLQWLKSYSTIKKVVIKNPECAVLEEENEDSYISAESIDNLIVYLYKDSAAEKFCQQYNIGFSPLNEEKDDMVIYGDLDGDKSAELSDLVLLAQYLIHDIDLNQMQTEAADVQYDGSVDVTDLARLKQYIMKDDIKLGK